jgi:hypothetical protein
MAAEWGASIIELSRAGPLQLDPALLLPPATSLP